MEKTFIFVDAGFLSKLSKYFGGGFYLRYDLIKFCENFCLNQNLKCEKIFYYTAPPFQSTQSTKDEQNRKNSYDSFIKKLSLNNNLVIREGRCQKLVGKDNFVKYNQKAVDILMTIDLMSFPIKNKNIKKIILIACDSDFAPVIDELKNMGIKIILGKYFTKKRNTNFSRSSHLMNAVSEYVRILKEDFENCPLEIK